MRVPKANVVGQRGEGWKIANTTLKHERNMLASSALLEGVFSGLVAVMQQETSSGVRPIDSPVFRDRLLRLQARVLSMKYHSLRMLTCNLKGESTGVAGLVTKLTGCELSHQIAALAIDALGELGVLYDGSKYLRSGGMWQFQYMFSLGLIIGGGTAQIQKNIISERGLGMPREPQVGEGSKLMDFGLSEEQKLLEETIRRYLDSEAPIARCARSRRLRTGITARSGRGSPSSGVAGILVPEEHGGSGLDAPRCRRRGRVAGLGRGTGSLPGNGGDGPRRPGPLGNPGAAGGVAAEDRHG